MAKLNNIDRKNKQTEWLQWRWEFLRRREEYKKVYQQAPEKRQIEGYESVWEKEQVDKFSLLGCCLVNPEKSFNDIDNVIQSLKNEFKKDADYQEVLAKYPTYYEELNFFPATFWSHYASIKLTNKGFCIDVDLSSVNKLGALRNDLDKLIALYCNELLAKMPKIKKQFYPGLKEYRLSNDFERILETGDHIEKMKKEMGNNFTFKIAIERLYPELSNTDFDSLPCETCNKDECGDCEYYCQDDPLSAKESLYQQAFRDYNLYQDLIRGGYRGLSFP